MGEICGVGEQKNKGVHFVKPRKIVLHNGMVDDKTQNF